MAQEPAVELQDWQKLFLVRLVRCPAWQNSIRSLSYASDSEEMMHDNPCRMDPEDSDLDETPDAGFYSGCVVVIDAQHSVAKEWVRHVYEMVPDRGSMYMTWWDESTENPEVTFSTTDACLRLRAAPINPTVLGKEFLAKKDELLARKQASLISMPVHKSNNSKKEESDGPVAASSNSSMKCARLTWEALYEDRCLECLNPLLPSLEEHFQAYLAIREGSGKEVAVPLSFWNYRARRFLASNTTASL